MDAIIFKVELNEKYGSAIALFKELQKYNFEEGKNEGYSELVLETNSYISGTVINKIPTFLNVFDVEKQIIEKREEIIIKKIDFSIDMENRLFEIYTSSIKEAKRVYLTVSHTIKEDMKLHSYDITVSDILISLNNSIEDINFVKLNIKNFKIGDYAQGYFEIKNVETEFAWSLVKEYKKDITKASLNINYDDTNHLLSVGESGKIKISSRSKSKAKVFFDVLKEKVFKSNSNA